MEIVFEPDLSNGDEAVALVGELINILSVLQTCDCKMEGDYSHKSFILLVCLD